MKNTSLKIFLFFTLSTPLTAFSAPPKGWSQGQAAGMSYQMYRPKKADTKSSALMINMHGCTQKPEDLKQFGNWEASAELYNMTVILPAVPNGGVILGCWDYYGPDHNDREGNSGAIISLVQKILKDPSYKIDSTKVFVSGLSSGAGEAFVVGCLRPDLFAGVGLNSTPMVGTDSGDIHGVPQTAEETARVCQDLARNNSSAFSRQKMSIIYDQDGDHIVNPQHSVISAAAMALIYGAKSKKALDMKSLPGSNTQGSGFVFSDSKGVRLSLINNKGLGHAWAAGNKQREEDSVAFSPFAANSYINGNSVDYPRYLGSFFGLKPVTLEADDSAEPTKQ